MASGYERAEADPPRRDFDTETGSSDGDCGPDAQARATADRWIAQRLMEIGYDLKHPEAQQLADHLQQKGIGTLVNLKNCGKLFKECQKLVVGLLPPPPKTWNEESQRIIVVTVRKAIPRFITHSMKSWNPSLSAIDTYFVNYCLITFKGVYIHFCKEEAQGEVEAPMENVVALSDARLVQESAEDLVIARTTFREVISFVGSPQFAEYLHMSATGLTREQMAKRLEISVRTLDRRIAQWREQVDHGGWRPVKPGREDDRG